MQEAFQQFFDPNHLLDSSMKQTTSGVQAVALAVAGLFALIAIGYYYIDSTVNKEGFPFGKLFRVLTLVFLISSYQVIMYVPCEVFRLINKGTASLSSPVQREQLKKFLAANSVRKDIYLEGVTPDEEQKVVEEKGCWYKLKSLWSRWSDVRFFISGGWFLDLWGWVLVLVKSVMLLMAQGLVKVLYLLGPLAFLLAMLPSFGPGLGRWFDTFVSAFLTISTVHILDALLCIFSDHVFEQGANPFLVGVFNLTFSIFYMRSFWLTSRFVGGGEGAGKVLSSAVELGQYAMSATSQLAPKMIEKMRAGQDFIKK